MPKAIEVANELRKLADALAEAGEAEIRRPYISVSHWNESDKENFLTFARHMPRPLKKSKGWNDEQLEISYDSDALSVSTSIPRNVICEIVEPARPAVYKCSPILSEVEEESLA